MTKLLTTKEYEIHYYQVGFDKKVSLTTLMNFFQDVFVYQSEITETGFDYLSNRQLAWVISKWDIRINKYPSYGEKIKITLYPVSFKKFYIYRKYKVLNEDNEVIAEAISSWILLNTNTRKPCKIAEDLCTIYGLSLTDNVSLKMDKILPIDELVFEKIFTVGFSDIDTNGHVNNVKYVSWALDTMPQDIMNEYNLVRIKINYQKEATYNNTITSGLQIIRNQNEHTITCLHKIYNMDNVILAILESIWEKI